MKLKERFKKFTIDNWILYGFCFAMMLVGFYFAIAMSVKLASGEDLFGSSSGNITVVTIIWILTLVLLAYLVYALFFKKIEKKSVVHKEIINGKTVLIKSEDEEEKND